jgi:hypothetical protein
MKIRIFFGLAIAMALFSCKKEENDEVVLTPFEQLTQDLIKVSSLEDAGYTLHLYAPEDLFVGFNNLSMILTSADGEIVKHFDAAVNPMMDMGMMQHTTPYEPVYMANSQGAHMCNITFIMPSTAGDWTFEVDVELDGGEVLNFDYDLTVVEPVEARLISFESLVDDSKIFIALVQPKAPEVGHNTYELAVYMRESMMSFPAVDELSFEIEPEMPAMGHGSPNNEHPENTEDGHYVGLVNFTMTGYWKVNMEVFDSEGALMQEDIAFDITF